MFVVISKPKQNYIAKGKTIKYIDPTGRKAAYSQTTVLLI